MNASFKNIRLTIPALSNVNYQDVEDILGAISGVQCPGINTPTNEVSISYYPELVSLEVIVKALIRGGFSPTITEIE